MSFFDGLFSAITPGLGSVISAGVGLLGNVVAGDKAQDGYDEANAIAARTAQAQLDELKRGKAAGVAAIDQGTQDYQSTVQPLLTERPILLPQYRGLTTQQQMGRDDLLRTGQAMLASTGLRGAGRAGVGTVLDSMARYNAQARDTTDAANRAAKVNARGSADAATTGLATIKANAGTAKANTEIGAGSQNAAVLGNQGLSQQRVALASGDTAANLATANSQIVGNTAQQWAGYNLGNSPNQPAWAPTYDPTYGPQRPRETETV